MTDRCATIEELVQGFLVADLHLCGHESPLAAVVALPTITVPGCTICPDARMPRGVMAVGTPHGNIVVRSWRA